MTQRIPVLEDLPDLAGKSVLVRADLNVPLVVDGSGTLVVADDFRIRATLPTIEWLRSKGASVTVCTHFGRPHGKADPRYDLAPVRARLAELAPGVELLENLRFDPGEEANDPRFVDRLVAGHDAYVNDAFGVSHRRHASVVGPPGRLPSAAGRLVAREVEVLSALLDSPTRPFVVVVGGAKVSEKIGVLRSLIERVDQLVVGGGMSYTFLAARGHQIGASLFDESMVKECVALLETGTEIVLPSDVVALSPGGMANFGGAPENEDVGTTTIVGTDVPDGWTGLDIGPATRAAYRDVILAAGTVLWNGPMGVCEDRRFAEGTRAVAEAVAHCPGFTVVGGGESAAALEQFGIVGSIDHVSTGGGASLEFLEQGDLPGLAALRTGRGR